MRSPRNRHPQPFTRGQKIRRQIKREVFIQKMPRRRRGMGGGGGLFGGRKKKSGGGLFGGKKAAHLRKDRSDRPPGDRFPPRPASSKNKTAPPPARTQTAPPPARREGGGIMSGIASTVVQGMAFGTGSAIAHRAVGGVANAMSGDSEPQTQQQNTSSGDAAE